MTHDALAAHLGRYTLTVEEAARDLGVSPTAIRQAVRAGRLPAVKILGTIKIAPEDLSKVVHYFGEVDEGAVRISAIVIAEIGLS